MSNAEASGNEAAPEPVRIVIAGGGTAGWMAAAAFGHFLEAGFTEHLVESEAIGTVGVGEATIPQIRVFNQALGIDEDAFIRATKATFKLAIEFVGWGAPDSRLMHAFGDVGRDIGLCAFQHYWSRAQAACTGAQRSPARTCPKCPMPSTSTPGSMPHSCAALPRRAAWCGMKA